MTDYPPVASAASRVFAFDGGPAHDDTREVAVETPVQVAFADVPFAVMMLTPADLVDFAHGFSLTEGVIDALAEIRDVTVMPIDDGIRLRISLVSERLHKHLARQRAMTGRTGCGICGIDDIEALRRARAVAGPAPRVAVAAIGRALRALDAAQALNVATRAVHGAAWASPDGDILHIREDVGRHNALDKLIGACLRAGINPSADPAAGFIVITSRCSFEMVEKAAAFGVRTLVAISAPTSLAIERARTLDVTLLAIARRDTLTAFHGADRLVAVTA